MIPYGRQDITSQDIEAVVEVLRSDFLTQGPMVPRFERLVAGRVGVAHAVAANSATSALHIACLALGLGPGDRLWTVPNTFVASANCGRYCGADVDFVDIDPRTWNISLPALREKLAAAETTGTLPAVVVPVHFGGQPTDQEAIWELAGQYGFKVLEDASHAIGASRHGEAVGSCRWSHATIFSFHPVKIVTTGEGGMAVTNDAELAARMEMLRSHGITRDPRRMTHAGDDASAAWYYEQQLLGFNYRLTDLHAALGVSQLDRLEAFVERRNVLARRYDAAFANGPLQGPTIASGNRSAYHLYVVRVPREAGLPTRRQVFDALRADGIGVNLHYMPVHLQPYYQALGFRPGYCPAAEAYAADAITLPLYASLSDADQDAVVRAVERTLHA